MDRLRRAYQAVAAVLVPLTAVYTWHVIQFTGGPVSRGEAAFRALISVGMVVWAVLWVGYAIGTRSTPDVWRDLARVAGAVEESDRDRDLQIAKVHDAIAAVREETDRELKTSMSWVIQRFKDIDPRS